LFLFYVLTLFLLAIKTKTTLGCFFTVRWTTESIEWFEESQACSRSYDSNSSPNPPAGPPPPPRGGAGRPPYSEKCVQLNTIS
jgi:hypothetical protein